MAISVKCQGSNKGGHERSFFFYAVVCTSAFFMAGILLLSAPVTASAAVGISPARIEDTLVQGDTKQYQIHFLRSEPELGKAMTITASSTADFITITNATGGPFKLLPEQRDLTVQVRVDTRGLSSGAHEGVVILAPDLGVIDHGAGNQVKVQIGEKMKITVVGAYSRYWSNFLSYLSSLFSVFRR